MNTDKQQAVESAQEKIANVKAALAIAIENESVADAEFRAADNALEIAMEGRRAGAHAEPQVVAARRRFDKARAAQEAARSAVITSKQAIDDAESDLSEAKRLAGIPTPPSKAELDAHHQENVARMEAGKGEIQRLETELSQLEERGREITSKRENVIASRMSIDEKAARLDEFTAIEGLLPGELERVKQELAEARKAHARVCRLVQGGINTNVQTQLAEVRADLDAFRAAVSQLPVSKLLAVLLNAREAISGANGDAHFAELVERYMVAEKALAAPIRDQAEAIRNMTSEIWARFEAMDMEAQTLTEAIRK